MRALQKPRKVTGHDAGRRQGFAGVGQQGFSVDVRNDGEHRAGLARGFRVFRGIEMVIQRTVGGFVKLFGVGAIVGGNVVSVWGIWRWFDHSDAP
ncbi:hypothetical protein D3C86_1922250 [compost metagenome]